MILVCYHTAAIFRGKVRWCIATIHLVVDVKAAFVEAGEPIFYKGECTKKSWILPSLKPTRHVMLKQTIRAISLLHVWIQKPPAHQTTHRSQMVFKLRLGTHSINNTSAAHSSRNVGRLCSCMQSLSIDCIWYAFHAYLIGGVSKHAERVKIIHVDYLRLAHGINMAQTPNAENIDQRWVCRGRHTWMSYRVVP